jgi:hypothetical protein
LESAAYSKICEHLQKPHNAGSRREARFFNTLLKTLRPDVPGDNDALHFGGAFAYL